MPFWCIDKDNNLDLHDETLEPLHLASYKVSPVGASFSLRYPISIELPHIDLPVRKEAQETAEGMLDTGGACTMGDLVAKRVPGVTHYDELKKHQEKPITSG